MDFPTRDGPPQVEDMVHAHGSTERFEKTQQLCNTLIQPMGFGWDDVEGETLAPWPQPSHVLLISLQMSYRSTAISRTSWRS